MSECRRSPLAVAALALALAGPASAQTAAQYARIVARVNAEKERVTALTLRSDSTRRARQPHDTVRVGLLTILSPADLTPVVRQAAESTWPGLERRFGAALAPLRRLELVALRPDGPDLTPRGASPRVRVLSLPRSATWQDGVTQLRVLTALVLREEQDDGLADWLRSLVPAQPLPAAQALATYVDLATSPWAAVRACYAEDLRGCRRALGVADGRYIDQWYDDTDLPHLFDVSSSLPASLAGLAGMCRSPGRGAACAAALRGVPIRAVPPPLEVYARLLLVDLALANGGPGAYERLLATPGPMAARLEAASRLTIDSLVRVWRRDVGTRAPIPVSLSSLGTWTPVMWALLLLMLGLRSTRWR